MPKIDAIVLTGGASRRLGRPKTIELVAGRPLLARVTSALTGITRVIIVGPADGAGRADVVCREDPPGGGPLAALAAGLIEVTAPLVLLLAGDLPFLTPDVIVQLIAGLSEDADLAIGVDDNGNDQYLLAVWLTVSLRRAIKAQPSIAGGRLRDLYDWPADGRTTRVRLAGDPPPWWDCDTAAELEQARAWSDRPGDQVQPHTSELIDDFRIGAVSIEPNLDDVVN
ncbi:MAG: molybdopterin-guanine dinucleotide biosynthesis protein [Pseudonocardiales bacterium]|nr:molybdopterin-guanine dinucleotide biosynthesis protein [Pseudonocardiales bacterium]